MRAAVERHELLSFESKGPNHDASFRPRPSLAVPRHLSNLRVLEERGIEVHRLFGIVVEPEKWDDLLHRTLLLCEFCQMVVGANDPTWEREKGCRWVGRTGPCGCPVLPAGFWPARRGLATVSYTHLRAHETDS